MSLPIDGHAMVMQTNTNKMNIETSKSVSSKISRSVSKFKFYFPVVSASRRHIMRKLQDNNNNLVEKVGQGLPSYSSTSSELLTPS